MPLSAYLHTVDLCVPPAHLVQILNDTIHHGAKRVAGGDPAGREEFIADQIRITERLVGFRPDPATRRRPLPERNRT